MNFTNANAKNIYSASLDNKESETVVDAMVKMYCKRCGNPSLENYARYYALKIEDCVYEYEQLTTELEEKQLDSLNEWFDSLSHLSEAERCELMSRISFSLDVYSAPELLVKYRTENDLEKLFAEYTLEDEHKSSLQLQEELINKFGSIRISDKEFENHIRRIKDSTGMLSAAQMGKKSHDLKCLAAMEMFLSHGGSLSVENAAYAACADVQVKAIADAVDKGMLILDLAKVLFIIAVIAAIILYCSYSVSVFQMALGITEATETAVISGLDNINRATILLPLFTWLGSLSLKNIPRAFIRIPKGNIQPVNCTENDVDEDFKPVWQYNAKDMDLSDYSEEELDSMVQQQEELLH